MVVVILFINKQIDRDGKYEYSSVVSVTPLSTAAARRLSKNYPNPFSKTSQGISPTNIAFSLPKKLQWLMFYICNFLYFMLS